MLSRFVTQRRFDEGVLDTTHRPIIAYCGCCFFYICIAIVGGTPLLAMATQAALDEASEVAWELGCFDEQKAPKGYIQHLSDCPVADHKVGSFKLTNATKYLNGPSFSGGVSILGNMSSGEVKPWKSQHQVSILLTDKGNVPADKMIMRGRRPYSLGSVVQNMFLSFVLTLMFGSCYIFPDKSIALRMTFVPSVWFTVAYLLILAGIPYSLIDAVLIGAVVIAILYFDKEEGYKILAITGAACGACLSITLLAYMVGLQDFGDIYLITLQMVGVAALLWFIPPEFFDKLAQLWSRVSSRNNARVPENIVSESAMASAPEPLLGNRYEETSASVGAHESAAQASSAEQGLATSGTITTTSTDNSHMYRSIGTGIIMGVGASVVLICVLAFVMVFISPD